jgi:LysM repeat protein
MKLALLIRVLKKIFVFAKKVISLNKKIPSLSKKRRKKGILKTKCNKGADHWAYTTEKGETLQDIAAAFGCPNGNTANIMHCNGIQDPNITFSGQVIQVPFYYYTVKSGDTVYSIALAHQITQWDLWAINNDLVGPDYKVQMGQKLKMGI